MVPIPSDSNPNLTVSKIQKVAIPNLLTLGFTKMLISSSEASIPTLSNLVIAINLWSI